jgi:hypothetical protein
MPNVSITGASTTVTAKTTPDDFGPTSGGGGEPIPVTFSTLSQNGSATQTTTQLNLTFSQAITGLTAADITLSGVSGVTRGALSGSGPSYTLDISGVTVAGTLTVAVAKSGYAISGSSKTVAIYYYSLLPPPPPLATPGDFSSDYSSDYSALRFVWNTVPNASGYVFGLIGWSNDGIMANNVENTVDGTTYTVNASALRANVWYAARVKAKGNGTTYSDSDWSEIVWFAFGTPDTLDPPTLPPVW